MKLIKLNILALLCLSSVLSGASTKMINCESFYQVEDDMHAKIHISAEIEKVSDGNYQILSRLFDLTLFHDDYYLSPWYHFVGEDSEVISNNQNYNPRKYKGHISFNIDKNLAGIEDGKPAPYGLFGSADFLVPGNKLDQAKSGDELNTIVILTHIADHWGASRTLKCQVTEI